MNDMKRDLIRIQELVGMAFSETGSLVALTDGGQMNPNKLQKTLEQTMEQFERTTLELRRLCERYSPGAGGFAHRPALPYMDITGSVETFGYGWLHITLHTLLPHCRYQTPNWLSDTIRRLLDEYETCGKKLPFYSRAMLVIDEHTGIEGRHIYDQDNKGWKAISNATSPSAFRYAVRYEGHTDLAPYEFFECCNVKSDDEILGAAVQHYDVVEIDDGIKPAFFYKTEHGYELLFSFDAKTAKKNIREEID